MPPLFLFHGLPGSRLDTPEMWSAQPSDVWIIAPDRPGMGLSTFQPKRRLTDWADDVRQLADSLNIERFFVAGFSAGGPYALAVAHGLRDRVIATAVISGAGMFDNPEARTGMNPLNKLIFAMARTVPAALALIAAPHARQVRRDPAKVIDKAAKDKHLPEADRKALSDPHTRELMVAASPESFRQGVRGFIQEGHIAATPWGFNPAEIESPVSFWHGDKDANSPIASMRILAASVPHCRATVFAGEGHLIVPRHWNEIVAVLLSDGRQYP
jgi:pimeloyl-ACP methyl ester carboxylesterase